MRVVGGTNLSGKLLHLKRFFVERKPTYLAHLENLTAKLEALPNQTQLLVKLRNEMVYNFH